jgi:hypothetical protein
MQTEGDEVDKTGNHAITSTQPGKGQGAHEQPDA